MTIEWLEEQLSKALDAVDKRDAEINELKDIIEELLPITENQECIGCAQGWPFRSVSEKYSEKTHFDGSLCFWHPHYDRARKVLGIETESD